MIFLILLFAQTEKQEDRDKNIDQKDTPEVVQEKNDKSKFVAVGLGGMGYFGMQINKTLPGFVYRVGVGYPWLYKLMSIVNKVDAHFLSIDSAFGFRFSSNGIVYLGYISRLGFSSSNVVDAHYMYLTSTYDFLLSDHFFFQTEIGASYFLGSTNSQLTSELRKAFLGGLALELGLAFGFLF